MKADRMFDRGSTRIRMEICTHLSMITLQLGSISLSLYIF